MSEFVNSAADKSLNQALALIEGIAQNSTVEVAYRAGILRKLVSATKSALFEILPEPQPAKINFKSRSDKSMKASSFVLHYYSDSYGITLNLAHIRKFDFTLYKALMKERNETGWPEFFHICTKQEMTHELFENLSKHEIEEILALGNHARGIGKLGT